MSLVCVQAQTYKGLSRMRGNLHVRFLGGGVTVMFCCYPTFIITHCNAKKAGAIRPFLWLEIRLQEIGYVTAI